MNRALIFGIAIFFAVVGISLMGADNTAVAGHGCCGCDGGCGGCGGGCGGCGGLLRGLFGCHGGHGCCGNNHCNSCCGYEAPAPACGCCGYSNGHGGAPADAPAAEPPAPAPAAPAAPAPSAYRRAPAGFRTVSFRR